jgi:hypothetical protein
MLTRFLSSSFFAIAVVIPSIPRNRNVHGFAALGDVQIEGQPGLCFLGAR